MKCTSFTSFFNTRFSFRISINKANSVARISVWLYIRLYDFLIPEFKSASVSITLRRNFTRCIHDDFFHVSRWWIPTADGNRSTNNNRMSLWIIVTSFELFSSLFTNRIVWSRNQFTICRGMPSRSPLRSWLVNFWSFCAGRSP